MFDRLTRRGLLGRLLAGLLALLRPAAAMARAGCPHPAHLALYAARPRRGLWYRLRLRRKTGQRKLFKTGNDP